MSKRVLVYSSLNIDSTFYVDHINMAAETQSSSGFRKSAGGKGANQSGALAKAGAKVFFAGKAGEDGKFIIDKLNSIGVDTRFVFHTDSGSGQAIIQLDRNGQNSIILYGGGNLQIEKEEIDRVLDFFDEEDYLVLDGEINNLAYIMEKAYSKKMRICVNPSPINDEVLKLDLNKADFIIVNEIEGAALCNIQSDDYETLCKTLSTKYCNSMIILTAGANGEYVAYNGCFFHHKADKTVVRDTTGAGDTFLGYFIACTANGVCPEKAVETASHAASLACSREGALDSIPSYNEINQ